MGKNTAASFARLNKLSVLQLGRSIERVVKCERQEVAAVIAHLAEMARRDAHLELGYKNLFEYCVRHLRLSEGSVWSRIQVANVCRKYPQMLDHLASGKVSLSVAGRLAAKLTRENVDALLEKCEGRTKREVEEILVALEPKREVTAGIRRAPTSAPPPPRPQERVAQAEASAPTATTEPHSSLEPVREERYNFRFCADKVFKEKLERLAKVLGTDAVEKNMAEVIEKALDMALDRRDPRRKLERRRKRAASVAKPRPDEVQPPRRSRYVPSSMRERCMEKASYCCEYRGRSGVRCTARAGLEIDHIEPYGKGGSSSRENLRVLCKRHNLLAAKKSYGEDFILTRIERRLQATSAAASPGRGGP